MGYAPIISEAPPRYYTHTKVGNLGEPLSVRRFSDSYRLHVSQQ